MNHKVIDELIEATPEKAATLQLTTTCGNFAGVVRMTKHTGVYDVKMIALDQNKRPSAIQLYVDAAIVGAVTVPTAEQLESMRPGNGSGLHIPGRLS